MTDGLQGGLASDERHVCGRAPLRLTHGGHAVPSTDGDSVGDYCPTHREGPVTRRCYETDNHQGTPISIRHMDVLDVTRSGGRGISQDLGGSTPQHLPPNG
jgi:hypothetical protein